MPPERTRKAARRLLERLSGKLGAVALRVHSSPEERETARRRERERAWYADDGDMRLRFAYPLDRDALVLDVGGFRGDWAAEVAARFGCRIHVFEPLPAFAEEIARRFAANDRVVVHAVGLADRDSEEEITVDAGASSSVILAAGAERVTATFRDGAAVLDELCGPDTGVDLLKVNIEGGEYGLLERLIAAGAMARVRFLQVQFHPQVPDADERRERIRAALARTHEEIWCYPWVWESWDRRPAAAPRTANVEKLGL